MVDADPAADAAALATLAAWCERYTPLAAAEPPDGFFLDITGCGHLFGDEAGLLAHLEARLRQNNLQARMAVAGSPGAAWALARSPTARVDCFVLPPGGEAAALAPLPVALLRLDRRCVAGLRRIGLKSIGELARQPRADLAARFGARAVLRLDQALGGVAEAIAWPRQPAPWSERLAFAEPIGTPDDLARALTLLARRLCDRLRAGQRGGHAFVATFFCVDDRTPEIGIATALPVDDPGYAAKLLLEKLDTVDPGFGVEAMLLDAAETAPLHKPQMALGGQADATLATGVLDTGLLATTVDQLANRLGHHRLWRPAPHPSHVPERAIGRVPPLSAAPAWDRQRPLERPLRLLRRPEPIEATAPVPDDPPIQFRWRGALHRVRAASGPERIAAEWWRRQASEHAGPEHAAAEPQSPDDEDRSPSDRLRDYYRVEDSTGARFWIFRAGIAGLPRWFLHGLFG